MNTSPRKILVVGAGASGLMAAALLAPHYEVVIIEARERTGCRICTFEAEFGFHAEAGAEFVHGDQPLTQELQAASSATAMPFDGQFDNKENGRVSRERGMFDEHWNEFVEALDTLDEDQPIARFLDCRFSDKKYEQLRKNVKHFAEGYDAADLAKVSAFALREEWSRQDDDEQKRVHGGYQRIIRHLEKQVEQEKGKITYAAVVSRVNWTPGAVALTTADGRTFEGQKVLITVPLGVLQYESIAFSPALPSQQQALKNLGFGGVIKFLFQFTPEFWQGCIQEQYPGFAFIFSDARVPTWWSQSPADIPLITGWLAGPDSISIMKHDDLLFEEAVNSLCYLLDVSRETLVSAIVKWHIADWVNDPFSRGAYGYATVGSHDQIALLLNPVSETIYFAGEALYEGSAMGTVEAALSSGRDAAHRILK